MEIFAKLMLVVLSLSMLSGFTFSQGPSNYSNSASSIFGPHSVTCNLYNHVKSYAYPIEMLVIVISLGVIIFEALQMQRSHLAMKTGDSDVSDTELSKIMGHSMTLMIIAGIILVSVAAAFVLLNSALCNSSNSSI